MDPTNVYSLGTSPAELARLNRQNEALADETRWLFDRLEIAPGCAALDVGCGPRGVLELLSERVGPEGRVVGLDVSEVMLAHAQGNIDGRGLQNVELVHANGAATGLERASFDIVHERLVLVNIPNPSEVVAEMAALARPGGVVALAEVDAVSWACDPPHPAWSKLFGALNAVLTRRGCDLHIGLRLGRMLRDAGLIDVRIEFHARSYGADHVWRDLLLHFSDITRADAVANGLLEAAEVPALRAALAAHLADPNTALRSPIVAQAWGRKPEMN